jgi:small subunit ribosomal protein S16
MKRMGRKHRAYFRICAVDSRSPRDGKVIEEIGTYDPKIPDIDARVTLNQDRLQYWLGVGAKPSIHVATFIKKYGPKGERLKEQNDARERLALPKIVPPAPEAVYVYQPKSAEQPQASEGGAAEGGEAAPAAEGGEAPAAETPAAESSTS